MRTSSARTRVMLAALAIGASLTAVAACGKDSSPGMPGATAPMSSASAVHNAEDTKFAQMMIMHHQQAVQMANMAIGKANSPDVKQLAQRIAAAQQPEISTMSGWLSAWGEHPIPAMPGTASSGMPSDMPNDMPSDMPGMDHGTMPGMDHSGMDHPVMPDMAGDPRGMVSMADIARLAGASGADFDKLFLQLMITHHEGAIGMARTEQNLGMAAEAKAMAKQIETTQSAEIDEMRRLAGPL